MKKYLSLVLVIMIGCQSVSKAKLVKVPEYPFADRLVIALLDFESTSGNESNAGYAAGMNAAVIEELMKYHRFRIIERTRLEKVLEELDLALAGMTESDNMKKVGKLLGADALLFGGIKSISNEEDKTSAGIAYTLKRKTNVELWARLVYVETGEILAASTAEAYVSQKQSVAFGFVKSGTFSEEGVVVRKALKVAIRQLANDIANRAPSKSSL